MEPKSIATKLNPWIIFFILTMAIMILAKELLIPIAWAIFLAFLLKPVSTKLEDWGLSRTFSTLVVVLCVTGVLMAIAFFVSINIMSFAKEFTDVHIRFESLMHSFEAYVNSKMGFNITPYIENDKNVSPQFHKISEMFFSQLTSFGASLIHTLFIVIYLFFILYYRRLVYKFICAKFSGIYRRNALLFLEKSSSIAMHFMTGTIIITIMMGCVGLLVMLLLGVSNAIFLAILLAALNLIPYIGNVISSLLIFIYIWITKDSVTPALIMLITLQVAHFIQENVVRPWLVGTRLEMNAFFVFVSVIIGGIVWGLSGMILFIPLTAIAKTLLEMSDETKAWAILLGADKENKKPIIKHARQSQNT